MTNHTHLMHLIGYPLIAIGGLEFFLAFLLIKGNTRKSPVNRSVAAFSFFAAAYAFITGVMYVSASYGHDITFLARANWISWMMIPAGLQFVFYMRDEQSRAAQLAGRILYPFWFLVFCLSISTKLIEKGRYALLPFVDRSGPLENPLRIAGSILILWFIYETNRLRRQATGIKRTQLTYFIHGIFIFAGGGVLLAGILQMFGGFGLEPGLGSFFGLPWVVLTFYAITRHRLFDIRVIIFRTATIALIAGIFSLVQIGFFTVLAPVLGASWAIVVSVFFLGFVFFGTPLARMIRSGMEKLVLQSTFDYQRVLKESSRAIMTILDLDELLDYLVQSIRTSLRVEHACLYLRDINGQYVKQYGMTNPLCREELMNGSIIDALKKTGQILIRGEMTGGFSREEFEALDAWMATTGAELYMPLHAKGTMSGVLVLGKKSSGDAYTESDIELLEMLAGHAAIAIENAQLYEHARRTQESLRESQERFRNLVETTSDCVWEMNQYCVYTYVSPRMRDILGYEPEEMLGRQLFDFMPHEEAKRVAQYFSTLIAEKKPFLMYQNTHLHKSGRIVVIETSGVPVVDRSCALIGYRGIDRDVTRRNEMEGLLRYGQKMEAIGRLAAGVAHDFNNINTVVAGHANIVQARLAFDDPLRTHIDHILTASGRATSLTRSLLNFSKKNVVELRPVHLNRLIGNMDQLVAGAVPEQISFRFVAENRDLVVSADPVQLERVIMNLVSNAKDAMPEGGQLTVETQLVMMDDEFIAAHGFGKSGPYAVVIVRDTGSGIEEPTLKKIFEPFFTTKKAGKGTGFGLAIVYDIVKQHRGYITVDSIPGKGTSFYVYLPLVQAGSLESKTESPLMTKAGK